MIYAAFQGHADLMQPVRQWARASAPLLTNTAWPEPVLTGARHIAAACEVLRLSEVRHARPPWRIDSILVANEPVPVVEQVTATTPFATLRRFVKERGAEQPKVLVVAPMSGHFATLLRDTVRTMLQDHDVYVTDWHNMRDVPLEAGRFGFDEYTQHIVDFAAVIGPGVHVLAVCQPTVAALAAVALMSEDDHPATPASLTLMAGPIDCRIAPTSVNHHATSKPIEWFERHLISTVPHRHPGGGRRVYPGFVQLSAFIGMNRDRHATAFKDYYRDLAKGDFDKAEVTRAFYDEYMAVSDLSAEFFLETVDLVFQRYALAAGELTIAGRHVDLGAIRRTALVTVEGERDDICAMGQTLAAQDLVPNLRPYMRTHYVQPDVGHYGVFSGKRWKTQIYPLIRSVIHVSH